MVLLISSVAGKAQTGKITGQIHDEGQQPVVAATILLKKAADSSLVKVTLSDTTGGWQPENRAAAGPYRSKCGIIYYGRRGQRYGGNGKTAVDKDGGKEIKNSMIIPAIRLLKTSMRMR